MIAAICERVDGISLAIELAAARITSLTTTEILVNLARVEQLFAESEGPDQLVARAAYRQDWDNVRAAHAWSCATSDVQGSQVIVVNTAAYAQHGLLTEHAEWCAQTLALVATPDAMTARVLGNAAAWANSTRPSNSQERSGREWR